ncbi:MAG: glycosyltransferase [Bacteroidota bacterium]
MKKLGKNTFIVFFMLILFNSHSCSSKNILVLTFSCLNPFHSFIWDDITGLIDRKHNIHIIAQEKALQFYTVDPKTLSKLMPANYSKYSLESKCLYSNIQELFKGKHFDIIYAAFGQFAEKAIEIRNRYYPNAKIAVAYQGADISLLLKQPVNTQLKVFNNVDLFLPVSQQFYNRLISAGCKPEKTKVYYTGIDETLFTPKNQWNLKSNPKLLSIGRLAEEKGFEYSIQAFAEIANKYPKARYYIIGDGRLRGILTQLIRNLKLSKKVTLLGAKKHHELSKWLNKTDIFVMPSITGSKGQEEGIPNALKEAMFTALPCIGSMHTGIPEIIKNNQTGLLVREKNVPDLVKAIDTLLSNANTRERLGKAGYNLISQNFKRKTQDNFLEKELTKL